MLEVHVLWHPDDDSAGRATCDRVLTHFRGTPFSGLIGGGIEVYQRSRGWKNPDDAPRPIRFPDDIAGRLLPPQVVTVVPVIGAGLEEEARKAGSPWQRFVDTITTAEARSPNAVFVFPAVAPGYQPGTWAQHHLTNRQLLTSETAVSDGLPPGGLCRDLAQGIAQRLAGVSRIRIFLSHTKRSGPGADEDVVGLVGDVRNAIRGTRLGEFFDASDIQPGEDWQARLIDEAAGGAMLSLRTDLYPSREWCQKEMLIAKRHGIPIVILDAIGHREERGSFLMDHVARVAVRRADGSWDKTSVLSALELLVDECLKRELWKQQRNLAAERPLLDAAWWAPHAPEPITLLPELQRRAAASANRTLNVFHPDPPLGRDEVDVLQDLATMAGFSIDVMTPRQYAARGGI